MTTLLLLAALAGLAVAEGDGPMKKSETIEIRISHHDKEDLVRRSAEAGETLSGFVRAILVDYRTLPGDEAGADLVFGMMDQDGDGFATVDDMLRCNRAMRFLWTGSTDLPASEERRLRDAFAEHDRDGDGRVTAADLLVELEA